MNRKLLLLLAVSIAAQRPAAPPDITVLFGPRGGCTDAIVRELAAARTEVKVMAYSFTSAPIAQALAKAHERGVKVTVVLDDSNESDGYSVATYLTNHGIQVLIDHRHAIQHNKVILIDGQTLVTGSMNFTKAGEEDNAENLLIIRRADVVGKYLADFEKHRGHAREYQRR